MRRDRAPSRGGGWYVPQRFQRWASWTGLFSSCPPLWVQRGWAPAACGHTGPELPCWCRGADSSLHAARRSEDARRTPQHSSGFIQSQERERHTLRRYGLKKLKLQLSLSAYVRYLVKSMWTPYHQTDVSLVHIPFPQKNCIHMECVCGNVPISQRALGRLGSDVGWLDLACRRH